MKRLVIIMFVASMVFSINNVAFAGDKDGGSKLKTTVKCPKEKKAKKKISYTVSAKKINYQSKTSKQFQKRKYTR
ncbi:MAG: hypothetical protein NT085_04035 [candidate division SR1 bacterium]|nr:hypothetical protein [candidate division SR1 bacterium]